jgi:hypothetical protein
LCFPRGVSRLFAELEPNTDLYSKPLLLKEVNKCTRLFLERRGREG